MGFITLPQYCQGSDILLVVCYSFINIVLVLLYDGWVVEISVLCDIDKTGLQFSDTPQTITTLMLLFLLFCCCCCCFSIER